MYPFVKKAIISKKDRILGFAIYNKKLHYIAIHQNERGKDLGTKLMDKIHKNIDMLQTDPNKPRIISFFKKYGFKKVGQKQRLFGPRIIMRKSTAKKQQ